MFSLKPWGSGFFCFVFFFLYIKQEFCSRLFIASCAYRIESLLKQCVILGGLHPECWSVRSGDPLQLALAVCKSHLNANNVQLYSCCQHFFELQSIWRLLLYISQAPQTLCVLNNACSPPFPTPSSQASSSLSFLRLFAQSRHL